MLVEVLKNVMKMNIFLSNTISKLCDAVTAPVASTCDALAVRLQSLHDTGYLLYQKTKEELGNEHKLKDNVEIEAE